MANINKVLDRVRKLLALSTHTTSEAEAIEAASRASALMEEYQLSEALVRLDEPAVKPEPIIKARLEPNTDEFTHKRVAWKETIARAVAMDLGVELYYWSRRLGGRKRIDVRGMGRESAIQAWQYTCQYLWRAVDELADQAWEEYHEDDVSIRTWKNSFRVGCSARIAVRLAEKRTEATLARQAAKDAAVGTDPSRQQLALTIVERDRDEVAEAYKELSKDFGSAISSIGKTSSSSGYYAGVAAGNQVSLGGGRAGLAAGPGMLTD